MRHLKTYEQNYDEFENFLNFLKNFLNQFINKYNFSISGNYIEYKKSPWLNKERYSFSWVKNVYFSYTIFYINRDSDYFNIELDIKYKGEGIPDNLKKCLYFIEDTFELYGKNVNVSKIKNLENYINLEQFELYDKTKKYNL